MRMVIAGLAMLVVMAATIGLAADPAAAADVIDPGNELIVSVNAGPDTTISYSWTSGLTLQFALKDQAGNILKSSSGTYGSGIYLVENGAVYRLVWTNMNAVPVSVDYDVTVLDIGAGFFEDIGATLVLGLLVLLAIIVIIVVVVVLVVVLPKGKKQQPHPITGPGAGVVPPMGNNCAVCGTPINPPMAFCSKCGAKLR
jgi:hypothetical protein